MMLFKMLGIQRTWEQYPDMWPKPRQVFVTQSRVLAHWGRGGLETNKNILSTLQALVESTCHLPANNRLGTFKMFLQVPG